MKLPGRDGHMTRRRQVRPSVEGMEARQVLSAVVPLATVAPTSNQFLDPTGHPTAHEMRRQHVRFAFDGKFLQGRGRFDDVASQVVIKAIGTSTYFLHGDIQLGAFVPTDPSRPTSGDASSFDRNVNSNSSYVFDLLGSTGDLDRAGRPTKFTFTVNPSASGGNFSNATGSGTVTIRYLPKGQHRDGVSSEGRALVLIVGDVYTLRTNNQLASPLSQINSLNPSKIRL